VPGKVGRLPRVVTRDQVQAPGGDERRGAVVVTAKRYGDRLRRQVVGIPQDDGRALRLREGSQRSAHLPLARRPGQHAGRDLFGGLNRRGADPPAQLQRPPEPPAGHVTHGLGCVDERVEQREGVGLGDLDGLFGPAAAAAEQVVHPVGVHAHRGDGVVGRDERDNLPGHADYLRFAGTRDPEGRAHRD